MSKFYIIKEDETLGPFIAEELVEQNITPDTTVCAEGKDVHKRAGDIEELKAIFEGQTNNPPPFNPSEQNHPTSHDTHHETIAEPPRERYHKLSNLKFGTAVKSGLLMLFKFKGRARRSEFWWLILAFLIVFNLIEIVMYFSKVSGDVVLKYILFPLSCVLIVSATVRRLHDTGRSGFWIFLGLIPIMLTVFFNLFWLVTLIVNMCFIALLCDDSEKGENSYGPSPKYVDTSNPEQLLRLQNDKETKTSSILFPIITFIAISLFQSYLLISSFFSIFGSLFGGDNSTYDPFGIELEDSVRYANDSTFYLDDVDTTFLLDEDIDSLLIKDSLADTIATVKSDTTSATRDQSCAIAGVCHNCGNHVARTSRICPTCGKNSTSVNSDNIDHHPTSCFPL